MSLLSPRWRCGDVPCPRPLHRDGVRHCLPLRQVAPPTGPRPHTNRPPQSQGGAGEGILREAQLHAVSLRCPAIERVYLLKVSGHWTSKSPRGTRLLNEYISLRYPDIERVLLLEVPANFLIGCRRVHKEGAGATRLRRSLNPGTGLPGSIILEWQGFRPYWSQWTSYKITVEIAQRAKFFLSLTACTVAVVMNRTKIKLVYDSRWTVFANNNFYLMRKVSFHHQLSINEFIRYCIRLSKSVTLSPVVRLFVTVYDCLSLWR